MISLLVQNHGTPVIVKVKQNNNDNCANQMVCIKHIMISLLVQNHGTPVLILHLFAWELQCHEDKFQLQKPYNVLVVAA